MTTKILGSISRRSQRSQMFELWVNSFYLNRDNKKIQREEIKPWSVLTRDMQTAVQ